MQSSESRSSKYGPVGAERKLDVRNIRGIVGSDQGIRCVISILESNIHLFTTKRRD